MRYLPLEANPEVMNHWAQALGLDLANASFQDVYGLDPELLAMVPQPVYALLLLFPISEGYEKHRKQQNETLKANPAQNQDLIYFKQTIANACGTMGLLHALANSRLQLEQPLKGFFERCKSKTPAERAQLLEEDKEIEAAHEASANMGQSVVPQLEDDSFLHFITFVESRSHLWEMDGSKEGLVDHGPITGSFLQSAAVVVDSFIALDPGNIHFNLIALAASPADED